MILRREWIEGVYAHPGFGFRTAQRIYNFLFLLLSVHPKTLFSQLMLRLIETLKLVFIHLGTI